jgi:hypothetical protein
MNIVFKRIFVFCISILFLFTTFFVLTFFNGYEFDIKKFQFVRTGSLYIQTYPKSASVCLKDRKIKETTPVIVNHLIPDKYSFKIEKDGYKTWENEVEIKSGEVSIFEYEMIKDNIILTYLQNLSDNYFIPISEEYILYSSFNDGSSFYNIYLYDFENNINVKIYELENELKDVVWGANYKTFFLKDSKNNFFYYDNIDINNINDKISLDIKNIYPNLINKNEIIIETLDDIFILDLYSYNLSKIILAKPYSKLLFYGDDIVVINENLIKVFNIISLVSNIENLELINEVNIQGLKEVTFIDNYYVVSDYKNNLNFYDINFNKIFDSYATDYKYNHNEFLIFNSSELKIFDVTSNSETLLSRYGNDILDANFYKNEYILYCVENNLILKNIKYNNNIYLMKDLENLNNIININNKIYIIKKIENKNILFRIKL